MVLGIRIVTCAFSEMNGMVLRANIPAVEAPRQPEAALRVPVSFPDHRRIAPVTTCSSTLADIAAVPFAVTLASTPRANGRSSSRRPNSATLGVYPVIGRFPEGEELRRNGPGGGELPLWKERLGF